MSGRDQRKCPRCSNHTMIHSSFKKQWDCVHMHLAVKCEYSEPDDSVTAKLRGIVALTEWLYLDSETHALELSNLHDKAEDILEELDEPERTKGKIKFKMLEDLKNL